MLPKILLVDDEPRVLASLTRELLEEEFCEVIKASLGWNALEILQRTPDIAVICSDFRMPGMNGVAFLTDAQKIRPDATRIMLTGEASLTTAIDAVNQGKIFRFLLKPCPPEIFTEAIKAGIRQNQLITAERELLSKTLNSSVRIMMEILSALNPDLFSQSIRIRILARKFATILRVDPLWEVELASMLSQIGAVTIPGDVLIRYQNQKVLGPEEQRMIDSIPHIGCQLVYHIPRLKNIAMAIEHQDCPFSGRPGSPIGEAIPTASRILKILLNYDRYLRLLGNSSAAMQELLSHPGAYDPHMLEVFRHQVAGSTNSSPLNSADIQPNLAQRKNVQIEELEPGMTLVNDVLDRQGHLIIAKGTIITEVLKYRVIYYFWNQPRFEPVLVDCE